MAPGALAIDLATVLMTTAAHAAPDRKDVQALRGQHDVQKETNVRGGTTDELV